MNDDRMYDGELRERLVRIETKLDALVGNGQPGQIASIDARIRSVETFRDGELGRRSLTGFIAAALATAMAEILHLFIWRR